MATFVAPPSSSPRKQIAAGLYVARCYQMVDLGTHPEEYQGEKKITRKIRLAWEFPDEMEIFNEERGPEPFVLSKEYTYSMHEKSGLRKHLELWRGKKFSDEEARVFDAGKLLGVACLINVIAYTKQSGEQGVKIGSITPLMKGQQCAPAINPLRSLSFADFDFAVFDGLPKFLKEKIQLSPEYRAMTETVPTYQLAAPAGEGQAQGPFDSSEDELPF